MEFEMIGTKNSSIAYVAILYVSWLYNEEATSGQDEREYPWQLCQISRFYENLTKLDICNWLWY